MLGSRGCSRNVSALPSGVTERIVAMVSTWPWTKWPPIRVVALTARSKFTFEPSFRLPRFVRRSVSGETPTLNWEGVKDVMVRHVPFMLMLSPKWASVRISAQLEIVRDVPPLSASYWWARVVTAGWVRGI